MTDQQHPITIPPDLEEELLGLWPQESLQRAAQWGADMELEACCEFERLCYGEDCAVKLRRHRRPKPKSLAEEAQKALAHLLRHSSTELGSETIRRALERLQELEGQGDD